VESSADTARHVTTRHYASDASRPLPRSRDRSLRTQNQLVFTLSFFK